MNLPAALLFVGDSTTASSSSSNLIQVVYWGGGIFAALAAGLTLINNWWTKREELHWERLQKAETVIHEMYSDRFAHSALKMIDGSLVFLIFLEEFQPKPSEPLSVRLNSESVRRALLTPIEDDAEELKAEVRTICHCFDVLFYHLNRLEIYLEQDLLDFEHVHWQLAYYMTALQNENDLYERYVRIIAYPKVLTLAKRFAGRS